MKIMRYTVQGLGCCAVREQAVVAAKSKAVKSGKPVVVTAHIDDGRARKVQYNPDGSVVKLWMNEDPEMKNLSGMTTKELNAYIESLFARMDSIENKASDSYRKAYHECNKALMELNRRW